MWIQTASGKKVEIQNVKPKDIDMFDIAHSLSNICRFVGHTKNFYSVADHSVLCYMIAPLLYPDKFEDPRFALMVLLHDAAESIIGDNSGPLKQVVPQLRELEKPIRKTIYNSCGITDEYIEQEWANVLNIDMVARVLEGEYYMGADPLKDWGMEKPDGIDDIRQKITLPVVYMDGFNAKSTFLLFALINLSKV